MDITVGTKALYGVTNPREVEVLSPPHEVAGSLRCLVRFRTGTEELVPVSLLHPLPKRPSARRVSLKDLVKAANKTLTDAGLGDSCISDSEFERFMKKHGVGR